MLPERITRRIHVAEDGCWLWLGAASRIGYGIVKWEGASRLVHRVTYTELVGPVPEGLELDHLCRNRGCCNPAHLEAVTHAENMRRGTANNAAGLKAAAQLQRAKTHCPHGHPLSGENLRIRKSDGARECRACGRERALRHYHSKRRRQARRAA